MRFDFKKNDLCIVLIFLTCVFSGQMAFAEEKRSLRVGYLPVLSQLPLIVSYENDYLAYEKINVKLIKYNSFTGLEAAIRVGAIDMASIPVPIALGIAADGHSIKFIGRFHKGGSVLAVTRGSKLEDVRNKLIGVPCLDSSENVILSHTLGQKGLRLGLEFKTVGIAFSSVIKDLSSNRLDAIYLPEPFGTLSLKKCNTTFIKSSQSLLAGNLLTILVASSELTTGNKAAIREYLASIKRACDFIEKDIRDSGSKQIAIMQKAYFKYPEKIVTESLSKRTGGLSFNHPVIEKDEIKVLSELAFKYKILRKSFDLETLIAKDLSEL